MSFTELARRTGLSVSAAQQRVRRLEERGVIMGYAAVINAEEIGLPLTAFVSIKAFDPAAPDDAPDRLAHLTAIEACHSVAGDESYILKVRVGSPRDAGGPAPGDQGRRERVHAYHDRAQHPVREPPAARSRLRRTAARAGARKRQRTAAAALRRAPLRRAAQSPPCRGARSAAADSSSVLAATTVAPCSRAWSMNALYDRPSPAGGAASTTSLLADVSGGAQRGQLSGHVEVGQAGRMQRPVGPPDIGQQRQVVRPGRWRLKGAHAEQRAERRRGRERLRTR